MHFFLIANNLTTCSFLIYFKIGELLSWNKISYMEQWPEEYGSPFSQGFKKNLKEFFCNYAPADTYKKWHFPGVLPKETIHENGFVKCRTFWKKICD